MATVTRTISMDEEIDKANEKYIKDNNLSRSKFVTISTLFYRAAMGRKRKVKREN